MLLAHEGRGVLEVLRVLPVELGALDGLDNLLQAGLAVVQALDVLLLLVGRVEVGHGRSLVARLVLLHGKQLFLLDLFFV